MSDGRSQLEGETATVVLDPASDLVILVGRVVVRRTQDNLAECFAHLEMRVVEIQDRGR